MRTPVGAQRCTLGDSQFLTRIESTCRSRVRRTRVVSCKSQDSGTGSPDHVSRVIVGPNERTFASTRRACLYSGTPRRFVRAAIPTRLWILCLVLANTRWIAPLTHQDVPGNPPHIPYERETYRSGRGCTSCRCAYGRTRLSRFQ